MNPPRNEERAVVAAADTVAEAVAKAAEDLGVPVAGVRYRVLEEPKAGFLGWGARKARVQVWVHDSVGRHLEGALKSVRDLDGHHLVEVRGRELILSVFAPLGAGKPVAVERVLAAVEEYSPESLDKEAVRDTVSRADGTERVVGRLAREGERDGTFELHVSDDAMRCNVVLLPPRRGGRDVTLGAIRDELLARGITTGIDAGEVEAALADRRYNVAFRVASGRPPTPGTPGRIDWNFRTDRHRLQLEEDERGRVDFRELGLIESVKVGDLLARRIPPLRGEPGEDIYGRTIAAPEPEPVAFPEGENVVVEGDTLRAAIDGHVSLVGARVQVSPFLHVKGDVNYEVGNIDFAGTVCVDGLVEDAFSLKASGSAFVRKSIGKCRVEVGGNLVVVGGILGRQEADIRVGGDLVALFVEHSRLLVHGELMVHELILHSDVVVGGHLVMNGTRAALVGGSAFAGGDVTVRSVGGEGTTRTHIRAGVRIEHLEQVRTVRAAQAEDEEKLGKVEEALRALDHRGGSTPTVAAGDPRIAQLRATQAQLQSRLKAHREALRALDAALTQTSIGARVHVLGTAMAGTRIEIGAASLVLSAPVQYATFTRVGSEIKMNPYSGDL